MVVLFFSSLFPAVCKVFFGVIFVVLFRVFVIIFIIIVVIIVIFFIIIISLYRHIVVEVTSGDLDSLCSSASSSSSSL